MQNFTPLWRRFIKEWAEIQNIKKSDLADFQSAPYPRICRSLIGILKKNLTYSFINLSEKIKEIDGICYL